MVVQGMGGVMSLTGHAGSPPTRVGTSIGDITAGLFTAIGIQAALYERRASGRGRLVDVAMLDCQVAILENAIARYAATGVVPGPLGARHPSIAPFAAFRARDKHLVIAAGHDGMFRRLCEVLEAHATTGPGDLHCRVVARTNAHLQHVLGRVLEVPGIMRTTTQIALSEQVRHRVLPLVAQVIDEATDRPPTRKKRTSR